MRTYEAGTTAIEVGLLAAFICVVLIGVVEYLGWTLYDVFDTLGQLFAVANGWQDHIWP